MIGRDSFRWPRLPMVRQTEAAECGLACLAMIASYHGHKTTLAGIRSRFLISMKGMSLGALIRCCQALDLQALPVRVGLERLCDLRVPCVLHWQMNHFVVLKRATRNLIVIHDPATGVRKVRYAEIDRKFTGVALELQPTAGFQATRRIRSYSLLSLMGRVIGLKRALGSTTLLTIALELLTLLLPFFMQWVIDGVIPGDDPNLLMLLAMGFAVVVVTHATVGAIRAWNLGGFSVSLNYQWLANIYGHLLKLPYDWFEKRHLGDIINKFDAVRTVQRALTTDLLRACLDGVLGTLTLLVLFLYSGTLALLSSAVVIAYLGVRLASFRAARDAADEELTAYGRQSSSLLETVRGIEAVRLAGRAEERKVAWLYNLAQQFNAQLRADRIEVARRFCGDVIGGLGRIAIVVAATHLVLRHQLTLGGMLAFVAFREQFSARLIALIDHISAFRLLRVHADRIADIVHAAAESRPAKLDTAACEALKSREGGLEIVLEDIDFSYSSVEPKVLWQINLRIESGECVAVAGPSGCGKTTLMKIMLGLLKPGHGRLTVNGFDVNDIGLDNYRSMVGSVMQDESLFSGSINDNICFFDPEADPRWIIECARKAAIHDEICAMPMQYRTLIGDIGCGLSGGQKQRLLLARALYRRPRLLILDEATSHLDLENEAKINRALENLAVTRIIVAHRPETTRVATRIVRIGDLMGGGKRAESRRFTICG